MATSYEDLIGRTEINDLEAILSVSNTDLDAVVSAVSDNSDAIFTWDYEKGARPKLTRLYEKAKTAMWNGETDLPWDTDVDQEQVVLANAGGAVGPEMGVDLSGTPLATWTDKEWNGVSLPGQVIYEMHIGTFTREGTWEAAIRELPELAAAGLTVLEFRFPRNGKPGAAKR